MFVVPLLAIALLSQAFVPVMSSSEETNNDDGTMHDLDMMVKAQSPLLYHVVDQIRMFLGISKEDMMELGMLSIEILGDLSDMKEILKKICKSRRQKKSINIYDYVTATRGIEDVNSTEQ